MTVITPEESAEQTAVLLLHLAEEKGINPHEVKVITDNGLEFDVPDELAEAYLEALGGVEKASEESGEDEADAEDAPAPRKRGRPRKNTEE